jgi:hypothetical protein
MSACKYQDHELKLNMNFSQQLTWVSVKWETNSEDMARICFSESENVKNMEHFKADLLCVKSLISY